MEGDAITNRVEARAGGAKEERGGNTWALVVATPILSKGATMMDEGTTIEQAEVDNVLTTTVGVASWIGIVEGGGGAEVITTTSVGTTTTAATIGVETSVDARGVGSSGLRIIKKGGLN